RPERRPPSRGRRTGPAAAASPPSRVSPGSERIPAAPPGERRRAMAGILKPNPASPRRVRPHVDGDGERCPAIHTTRRSERRRPTRRPFPPTIPRPILITDHPLAPAGPPLLSAVPARPGCDPGPAPDLPGKSAGRGCPVPGDLPPRGPTSPVPLVARHDL